MSGPYEGKHKLEFEVYKDFTGWCWKPIGGPNTWAVRAKASAHEAYVSAVTYGVDEWRKWSCPEQLKETDERTIKIWHEASGWYWNHYDSNNRKGPFASRKDATDNINEKPIVKERTIKVWWDGSTNPWRWAFFNGDIQEGGSYGVMAHEGAIYAAQKALKHAATCGYKITDVTIKMFNS